LLTREGNNGTDIWEISGRKKERAILVMILEREVYFLLRGRQSQKMGGVLP